VESPNLLRADRKPMPEHDVVALNANFKTWCKERASGLTTIEPFLYYTVEHITKQYNLTDEQVQYGITDHPNDGGVDAIYCLAGKTNVLLRDDISTKITSADTVRIMVFQVKSSVSETGFSPPEIDKLAHFADDLLNLSGADLAGKYEARLITRMQTFKDKYLEVAHNFPRLVLEFYYVTRGDGETLTPAADAAVERLKQAVAKHRGANSRDEFKFEPADTVKLLEYVRRRRQFPRPIKWAQQPMPVGEGYVGMVRLADYYNFLKDEKGTLDELIFESNVRGSQGRTSVNRQMREVLDKSKTPDFWQLNNGITVTCLRINPIDAFNVEVHDAQVVNGLQTSRQIFGHFSEATNIDPTDQRLVMIKLIPVSDDKVRDTIIRATNNQNPMRAAALRATDERQRDIEDLFKEYGYFYDRRPGYWKDQGKEIVKIVSLNEIVQAMVALVLHRPDDAKGRPGDYVKEGKKGEAKYRQIFGASRNYSRPLGIFLRSVLIVRAVGEYLSGKDNLTPSDRSNLLFYVAYHVVCEIAQTASPSPDAILGMESVMFNDRAHLDSSFDVVNSIYRRLIEDVENPDTVAKGTELLDEIKKELVAAHGETPPVEAKKRKKKKVRDVLRDSEIK